MPPTVNNKKVIILQRIITLILVLILGGLAALYIYYGMNLAKQEVLVDVPAEVGGDANREVVADEAARRVAFIEELAKQSTSSRSTSEQSDIITKMVAESESTVSDEDKIKFLESLKNE